MSQSTNTRSSRSGTARFFIGLFKVIFLVAMLAVGILLGYLAWFQFELLNQTAMGHEQRIDLLFEETMRENDVQTIVREQITSSEDGLNNRITSLDNSLSQIETQSASLVNRGTELQGSITAQSEAITALEGGQATLSEELNTTNQAVVAVSEAVSAVEGDVASLEQGDSNFNTALAALAGEVAAMNDALEALQADVAAQTEAAANAPDDESAEAPAEEAPAEEAPAAALPASYATDLAWLQLWGALINSRLHIADENLGDAANAISTAEAIATSLAEQAPDYADELSSILENIAEAQESLDGKPAGAYTALSAASATVDQIIIDAVGQ